MVVAACGYEWRMHLLNSIHAASIATPRALLNGHESVITCEIQGM